MSRKRKITNRRSSAKPRSGLGAIGTGELSPMTVKDCAEMLEGEELRAVLIQVLCMQKQMLEHIATTILSEDLISILVKDLYELAKAVLQLPEEALAYLRTFLTDGVELKSALEMAIKLAAQDSNEDRELLLSKVLSVSQV